MHQSLVLATELCVNADFGTLCSAQVIEYIRQVKAWRNRKWDDQGLKNGRPKSYLLELLVIKAYENSTESSRSSQM